MHVYLIEFGITLYLLVRTNYSSILMIDFHSAFRGFLISKAGLVSITENRITVPLTDVITGQFIAILRCAWIVKVLK